MTRPLVTDEPVATGWLRTELHGDTELAAGYVKLARTLLGGMRTMYGVNARIAAGEPGGFYRQHALLADGTRIDAITNDGHDTLRIHAAAPQPAPHGALPLPEPSTDTYLWVGLRVKYQDCQCPASALMATMVEPDSGDTRGIVSAGSGTSGWYQASYARYDAQGGATLAPDEPEVDAMIAAFHASWTSHQPGKRAADHCLALDDDDGERGLFYFSKNGLRLYDVNAWDDSGTGANQFSPYDPQLNDADNAGAQRAYGGRVAGGAVLEADQDRGWDAVFVFDPDEEREPSDPRAPVVGAMALLRQIGVEEQALAGEYLLFVNGYGADLPRSDRAGDPIPSVPGQSRGAYSDYTEHMAPRDYTPMQVEVEVRIGKSALGDQDAGTALYNFDLVCDVYDNRRSTTTPFGYGPAASFDPCSGNGGPNPFGSNYSTVIAIDINGRSARQMAREQALEALAPVYGAGQWLEPTGHTRSPLDIYLFGDYGVSQVDDADYARKGGDAIRQCLEAMTAGSYGVSLITERTAAAIRAALAPVHKGAIWRYDVMANSVASLPLVSAPGDFVGDYYQDWAYWYYPYQRTSRNACRNTFAILLQADETFVFDGNQNLGPDVPAPVNCC